ncbi:tyrosine-type recombinase/integrase [Brevibacterium sp. UMB1308A]|uniref:tyrosine-type recombinase/integrase n=1 Tax=Brevibacterium sp. UMB1308A TaxID=3050608 RepID=UPI00254BC3D6|nr:tyrosine-type recombinase/integrase [Brevibacterium sp. UMB1308A]MDK8345476.1 tyrosine-type recombinase/integrase [Brevibacterium sp. UMB1308B]MDK8712679.1 tyrosine-type recombinase/integrase [Brevibacterium sp. UMB1308A]
MATIEPYQTKAGKRWRVRYRKPDRSQTDKRGFKTKRDAQLFAATVETSKATGTYIDPTAGRVTIGELGEQWLRHRTNVRPQTKTVYRTAFHTHITQAFATTPVAAITPADIRDWVATINRGPQTVRRAHFVLHAILETAKTDGVIHKNPADNTPNLPKLPPKRRIYLTHADIENICAHAPGEYRTIIYIASYIGLRFGEIKALKSQNIDTKAGTILVEETATKNGFGPTKAGEPRTVGIPGFMLPELREMKLKGGRPFYQTPYPKTVEGWWHRTITRAGHARLRFHDLRHTAASIAIASGASVKVVQNMLGHASATMTLDVYAALWEEDVTKTAERIDAMRSRELCGQNVGKSL